VVGWAAYGDFRDSRRWPGYRFTVEHTVHVARSHWGCGVGRALVEALADRARRDGKRVMVAGIDGSNTDSITFHARLGFHEVARLPGVGEKWGRRLDLVLMQRDLAADQGRADRALVQPKGPRSGSRAQVYSEASRQHGTAARDEVASPSDVLRRALGCGGGRGQVPGPRRTATR